MKALPTAGPHRARCTPWQGALPTVLAPITSHPQGRAELLSFMQAWVYFVLLDRSRQPPGPRVALAHPHASVYMARMLIIRAGHPTGPQ
jgi:hypothetical protein